MDPMNPHCPNYDPCFSLSSANADFVMVDSFRNFHCEYIQGRSYYYTDKDTCIRSSRIYLRATNENDSYQWIIGGDSSYPQARSFSYYVPENFPSDTLVIQLIVSNQVPDGCGLKKRDTLTQTLYIQHIDYFGDSWSLVIGSFHGADIEAPLDTFTIIVPPIFPTFQGIDNFPKGCTGQYHEVGTFRHGLILNTISTPCKLFCGVGVIQSDRKTLIIDYSITEGGQQLMKRWVGIKVE
jgi:hypothetical protein